MPGGTRLIPQIKQILASSNLTVNWHVEWEYPPGTGVSSLVGGWAFLYPVTLQAAPKHYRNRASPAYTRKKQGAVQHLFPSHLNCIPWGEKKKGEKLIPIAKRDSWCWYIARSPLLAMTTSPISPSYLQETDLLGWTVKDWFITAADKRESLWNFKTFKGLTSKKWTFLALGGTLSF